jgi:hypothetical protein
MFRFNQKKANKDSDEVKTIVSYNKGCNEVAHEKRESVSMINAENG